MRYPRRTFVAAVGGLALAGCLDGSEQAADPAGDDSNGGGGDGDDDPDPESASLLLNFQPGGLHAHYYAALDRGYYAEEGIDLEAIESGQGSDFSAQQAALGNTEFAITSGDQVLNVNSQEGLDLRCVSVVMQQGPTVVFTAREEFGEELTDASQLEGLTVGSGPGMVRTMTESFLDHHDVLDSVEYVDSGFDTVQQLLTGEIDAAGGVFSDVIDAQHQDVTTDVLSVNEVIPSYGHVVGVGDDYLEANPETVRGFIRATARGAAWAHRNPEEAIDVLIDHEPELGEVRENQLDKWVEMSTEYMLADAVADHGWGWNDPEPWEATHETLEAGDFLEGEVDPDDVWTNEFIDEEAEYVGDYATIVDE